MNILFASHTPDLKGSAISLCELMKGLDQEKYKPIAVFSKNGPLIQELEAHGIKSYIITGRGFLRMGTLREALQIIDREQIGLVHVNSAVPFSKYIGIAAKWRGLPVVWHIREDPRGKRVQRLQRWIQILSTRIIVLTSQQEQAFSFTRKVEKVYNGVDVRRFRPDADGNSFRDQFDIPHTAFVFGIVGSIEENKGTLNFLKAAQRLAISGADTFFVVVGGGMPEDVRRVREYAEAHPCLSGRTIFTGRMEKMPEVMCGLDVLVVASYWESFPRVIIESMACGKPAIAVAVGEIPQIVDAGRTGFLIPQNSDTALHQAMERCLLDRNRLHEMGRAALEKVLQEFTIEKHVQRIEKLYREVLSLE